MSATRDRKKSLRDSVLEKLPPKKQQQILSGYKAVSSRYRSYLKGPRKEGALEKSHPKRALPNPTQSVSMAISPDPSPKDTRICADCGSLEDNTNNESIPESQSREQREEGKSVVLSTCSTTLTKQKSESLIRASSSAGLYIGSCVGRNKGQRQQLFEEAVGVRVKSKLTQSVAVGEPLSFLSVGLDIGTVNIVIPKTVPKERRSLVDRVTGEVRGKPGAMNLGISISLVTEVRGLALAEEAASLRDSLSSELEKSKRVAGHLRRGKSLNGLQCAALFQSKPVPSKATGEGLCAEFGKCKTTILANAAKLKGTSGSNDKLDLDSEIARARHLLAVEKGVCTEYEHVLMKLVGNREVSGLLNRPYNPSQFLSLYYIIPNLFG